METKKIFLASSSELKKDRERFELFIGRRNKTWQKKGMSLELVIWEDFLDAVSDTRLQDEYNEAIKSSDLFVMLFHNKVGKYTAEEFDTAFEQFKKTNKPLIFTYFKEAKKDKSASKEDKLSVEQFQQKLDGLGHFYTVYKNTEDLLFKFSEQLEKLVDAKVFKFKKDKIEKDIKKVINKSKVKGDGNIVIQGVSAGGDFNFGSVEHKVSGSRGTKPHTKPKDDDEAS